MLGAAVRVGRAGVEMMTASGPFRRLEPRPNRVPSGASPWLSNGWSTSGVVVDDLAAATEFFVELGLVLQGEGPVEGR